MKKLLQKITTTELYFRKNGVKQVVDGRNKDTYPSGLTGDISELTGDISGLTGNISGVYGDATNISGDLDECKITEEEREKGINIEDLVG